MTQDVIYSVILAGGQGTRFWPKSRIQKPKQLCSIGHPKKKTLLEETVDRLQGWIPHERTWIVTHQDYERSVYDLFSDINVIAEPQGKNTAAALIASALEILAHGKKNHIPEKHLYMISLHGDHKIADVPKFTETIQKAIQVAKKNRICLVGIYPTRPDTGFGYLEKGVLIEGSEGFSVKNFKEKPSLLLAKEYLEQGHFLWNSGIFVWPVSLFLEEMATFLPETFYTLKTVLGDRSKFSECADFASCYECLKSIPIDTALFEKSQNVACVDGHFSWHDIGGWSNLKDCFGSESETGNLVLSEQAYLKDCSHITVDCETPQTVVALGLKDLVISVTGDIVFVCSKEHTKDIPQLRQWLTEKNRADLL